ncbi:MAG: hypothetical protein MI975_15460 [Cytophagales bacterium]|nr:hypothetical protein [Cytophagales bacterium]
MNTFPINKSIDHRIELFKQFYKRENRRPLFGFYYGSEYPIHRYIAAKSIPEKTILRADHFRVESFLDDFERLFDIHEECGGDFIWSASAFWGIPWLEAILGCDILLNDYNSGSIHAEKPVFFNGPDSIPSFSMDNEWVLKAGEFLEKAAKRSNGSWPIGTTRMRGIADLLALLYGDTEMIFAMMDKPEEVIATGEKLTEIWIKFGRFQLEIIPEYHGGVGSFYYNAWADKGTIWHQEDAVALLSPELYERFIRPFDEKIAAAFDQCIMHQHSVGYFPYEHYINMGFYALEIHIDSGGPSAEQLFDVHRKILEKKPMIIWGAIPENDLEWIFSKLPVEGLAVITVVDSKEQAAELWKKYCSFFHQ